MYVYSIIEYFFGYKRQTKPNTQSLDNSEYVIDTAKSDSVLSILWELDSPVSLTPHGSQHFLRLVMIISEKSEPYRIRNWFSICRWGPNKLYEEIKKRKQNLWQWPFNPWNCPTTITTTVVTAIAATITINNLTNTITLPHPFPKISIYQTNTFTTFQKLSQSAQNTIKMHAWFESLS